MSILRSASRIGFVLSVFCLAFPSTLSGQGAGCPSQLCRLTGSRDDCFTSINKEGCSIKVGDCTECTNWICEGQQTNLQLAPDGEFARRGTENRHEAAVLRGTAAIASIEQSGGIIVSLRHSQTKGPVALMAATFGVKDLFLSGVLANFSTKTLVAYRIGYAMVAHDHQPRTAVGAWMNTLAGIKPGATLAVPAQGLSRQRIVAGTRLIQFFVAEVKYADGGTWKENLAELRMSLMKSQQKGLNKES